jgi:hypothetical protein
MAEDSGPSITWSLIVDLMPKWLRRNYENLNGFVQNPTRWARQRIVDYILGAIGALIFGIADIIDQMWGIVIDAIDQAGEAVPQSISSAGAPVSALVADFHGAVGDAAAVAGPASPIIVVGSYAVVLYLSFIVLRAAAPAATDALGAIPIVGSALDAILTWGIGASSRLSSYLGGDD